MECFFFKWILLTAILPLMLLKVMVVYNSSRCHFFFFNLDHFILRSQYARCKVLVFGPPFISLPSHDIGLSKVWRSLQKLDTCQKLHWLGYRSKLLNYVLHFHAIRTDWISKSNYSATCHSWVHNYFNSLHSVFAYLL